MKQIPSTCFARRFAEGLRSRGAPRTEAGGRRCPAFGLVVWVFVLLGPVATSGAEPVVSNVRVSTTARPVEFEVTYDVDDAEGDDLVTALSVSSDAGRTYQVLTNGLRGDVGTGVKPGRDRRIVWQGPLEGFVGERLELRFRVAAREIEPLAGLVRIPAGTFTMGTSDSERDRERDEGPTTSVTLTRSYWLGKFEVTQREWESVMGSNPSQSKGSPDLPVENVSWDQAMEYCRRLTQRARQGGQLPKDYEFRLPTEAEWEYACRAGTTTATAFGDRLDSKQANFDGGHSYNGAASGPFLRRPAMVGSYPANAWGFHDMHGNVWEWCLDWYGERLPGGSVTNPKGPKVGLYRTARGGGWSSEGKYCRSAYRRSGLPSDYMDSHVGFRVACAPVVP